MRLQGTCPPSFRESTSWIISPSKIWTATIFLHAHLQVVYYKCAKFHKNPISHLGGVALTRYMDGRTDGQGDSYIPPQTLFAGGITTSTIVLTNSILPLLHVGCDFGLIQCWVLILCSVKPVLCDLSREQWNMVT